MLSPIFDRDGHASHFVGIQNDVTARVAFEEALRESEKLAATGRLAASIAHEINNPLEAVTNLLYLAERETSLEATQSFIQQASDELRRVSAITTQSLRLYRQSTKPKATRLADIASAVLDVYAMRMTQWNIVIEPQIRSHDSVVCLESEIRQVINNLVRNSMDAMRRRGGRLVVRVRNATRWSRGDKGMAITVADNGYGMSEETKGKLFQAFYTTKDINGTGLGLWLSQEIVARHHGELAFRSSYVAGKSGTAFRLFLPFQAANPDLPL